MQREENTCMPVRFADECACRQSGCKIAEAFHGTLTALFVEPANYAAEPTAAFAENIRLCKAARSRSERFTEMMPRQS